MPAPAAWNILQLDVSTFCPLRCPTCPRTAFEAHWRNAHVSREVVERLLPWAGRFKLAHLQGWGEPLAHPELPAIVEAFVKAGAPCGLTTGGTMLTERLGKKLLAAGLSQLTVSVSGGEAATQARLRPPSRLEEVLGNAARFKALAGGACQVRLSFLRQPENQHEMGLAVRLAAKHGLDGVLGVNPTYQPTPDHAARLVRPGAKAALAEAKARLAAMFSRQDLTLVDVAPDRLPSCLNRPQENLTVAVDGGVSPCVFLQLPLASRPEGFDRPLLRFGSVLESDLEAIWRSPEYTVFREPFARREEVCAGLIRRAVADMDAGGSLKRFQAELERMERDIPLPPQCAGCLKAQGL